MFLPLLNRTSINNPWNSQENLTIDNYEVSFLIFEDTEI